MITNPEEVKDPYLKKWLSHRKTSTSYAYLNAVNLYLKYTGMTPENLIKEASDDVVKPPIDRKNPVEERLKGFFDWATQKKKYSPKWAYTCVGAMMSFYRTFNYRVNSRLMGIKEALPKNPRFNWTVGDIRKLLSHAKCLRDRGIILCLFQGGLDDSTLCSLNFGNVKRELEAEKMPLRLDLKREKENLPYITFLGLDAVNALKAYLAERKKKEKRNTFKNSEPLFVLEGKARKQLIRICPATIQEVFRKLAVESGIVDEEELKKTHWNPARAHALRSAFMSLLRSKGLNEMDINFLVGHKIPYQMAYYQSEGERLRKTYANVMDVLSIYEMAMDSEAIKRRAVVDSMKALNPDIGNEQIEKALGIVGMADLTAGTPDQFAEFARLLAEQSKLEQKVVSTDEVQKYLDDGWLWKAPINNEKCLVERKPIQKDDG